jgi:hypothetical protein
MSQREINIVLLTVVVLAIFVCIILTLLVHFTNKPADVIATPERDAAVDDLALRRAQRKEKHHA